jgi:hypothetical protein
MQTVNVQQLSQDPEGVIAAAQHHDVLVVEAGRVVAVVSKPPARRDFASYWQERVQRLAAITIDSTWDSTVAVSEDRDRG